MTLNGLKYYLSSPKNMFSFAARHGLLNWMSDEEYIRRQFKLVMGYDLDLDNPRTFSEKLQWIKLNDRNPLYTQLVDKYEVRKYIAEKIGEDYLIPLVGGSWNSVEEIDFEALPEQFVLKCTHDSGGIVICRDKAKLDIPAAKAKLSKRLRQNYYWLNREWPYKNVQPRIIAEKYMEDRTFGELRDYKFFAFDGEVKVVFIVSGRGSKDGTKANFFDMDFNDLHFSNEYPNTEMQLEKPEKFDEMKMLAAKLSQGIPEVRVDFYEVNGKVYFGELTFFDGGGFQAFDPPEWDEIFGSWLTLPEKQ